MRRLRTIAGVLAVQMLVASGSSASDAPGHPASSPARWSTSATGVPVAGAYVGIGDFGDAAGTNLERFRKQGLFAHTETDEQGRFVLTGAAVPGEHPLLVTHPEHVRHDQTLALRGEGKAEVDVRLKPAATIEATAVDAAGNLAVITLSNGSHFGAGVVAGSTGVLLNNALASFSPVGNNAPGPGKRPRSYIAPTLIINKGQPMLMIGSAGGEQIPTSTVSAIIGIVDFGMDVAQGLDAPRTHQSLRTSLKVERFGTPNEVVGALEARGHAVEVLPYIGSANGILMDMWNKTFYGAADPRDAGSKAAGY